MIVRKRLAMALACGTAILGCGSEPEKKDDEPKEPILVAVMVGRTGPTAALATQVEPAIYDYVRKVNENGGIQGHMIEFFEDPFPDTEARPDGSLAIEIYDRWRKDARWKDVDMLLNWGTAEQAALQSRWTEDKLPAIDNALTGASTNPHDVMKTVPLPDGTEFKVDAKANPYQFGPLVDLSTAIRVGVEFMHKRGAKKIVFTNCPVNFCILPVAAGKAYAAELDMEVMPDMPVDLTDAADVVDGNVKAYLEEHPDTEWIWNASFVAQGAAIANAVEAYKPEAKVFMNTYGFNDALIPQCGPACRERVYGIVPARPYGDPLASGMQDIVSLNEESRKLDGKDPATFGNMSYVRQYARWLLIEKIANKALDQFGEVTKETVLGALESTENEGMGGITPPISFTPDDHRPSMSTFVYSVSKSDTFNFEDEIKLERRDDWIGW